MLIAAGIVIVIIMLIFRVADRKEPDGYYYEPGGVYEYGIRFEDQVLYDYAGNMTGTYRYENGLIYLIDADDGSTVVVKYDSKNDTIMVEGQVLVKDKAR